MTASLRPTGPSNVMVHVIMVISCVKRTKRVTNYFRLAPNLSVNIRHTLYTQVYARNCCVTYHPGIHFAFIAILQIYRVFTHVLMSLIILLHSEILFTADE